MNATFINKNNKLWIKELDGVTNFVDYPFNRVFVKSLDITLKVLKGEYFGIDCSKDKDIDVPTHKFDDIVLGDGLVKTFEWIKRRDDHYNDISPLYDEVIKIGNNFNTYTYYSLRTLLEVKLFDLSGWIELSDNKWLFKWYGKYCPNITWITKYAPERPGIYYKKISSSDLNFSCGDYSIIIGRYWMSNKGNVCFTPDNNGKYVLICDNWGGAFNSYRGYNLEKLSNPIHYRRASSNGGGSGFDYIIVKKEDMRYKLSIDDI